MNSIKPKIYNNIYEVRENIITPFQPIFISQPRCDKDVFSKNFSFIEPKKRGYLYKFANLSEHYNLSYNIFDLKQLMNLSKEKLKSLFLISSLKDDTGMLRFTPNQLLQTSKLNDETINFVKPFARQKNVNGLFNFGFNDIKELSNFTDKEKQNAMQLLPFKLPPQDLINISKDKKANVSALQERLSVINDLYPQNIYEMGVKKIDNNYVVHLTTEDNYKTYKYVFDNNFNLNPKYESNIDFKTGTFKKKGFLNKLKFWSKKDEPAMVQQNNNLRCSVKDHYEALGNINEYAESLKGLQKKMYRYNFQVSATEEGNLIDTNITLPKNMLVNYWKKGMISNSDLMQICSDYAELIPQSDLEYFALNKVKMTQFDNDKFLEIRKNNAMSKPVEVGSDYYKKVLKETLSIENEKLKNIKAERKLIIIDGLPGAGKSTIINSILKEDKDSFYTPDSDDIKAMFKEAYKNGEGANLVHNASGKILKNEIIPRVLEQGKNFIYQTTGNYVSINKIINQAAEKGYKIDFIQIPTSKNVSLERSVKRFNENGRFMDPIVTMSIFNTNNREKTYAAKIFSHNKNIVNSYIFENGKYQPIKEGTYLGEPKDSIIK